MRPIPICQGDELLTNPVMRANAIADQTTFNIKCNSDIASQILLPTALALTYENLYDYDASISSSELYETTANLKATCPGLDLVHNKFLKNLPEDYMNLMLNTFDASFSSVIIPNSWKFSLTLPI